MDSTVQLLYIIVHIHVHVTDARFHGRYDQINHVYRDRGEILKSLCACMHCMVSLKYQNTRVASMDSGPEDVSLLERCPHFREWYVLASMDLGPEDVSLLERCPQCATFVSMGCI